MSSSAEIDVLASDWVKKVLFDTQDSNAQTVSKGERGPAPRAFAPLPRPVDTSATTQAASNVSSDSYLSSLISSSPSKPSVESCTGAADCSCYKCRRQKRRAGTRRQGHLDNDAVSTASRPATPPAVSTPRPVTPVAPAVPAVPVSTPIQKEPTVLPSQPPPIKRAATQPPPSLSTRKPANSKAYADYLAKRGLTQYNNMSTDKKRDEAPVLSYAQYEGDTYQISWKDDSTGDDLLTSLQTFQSIFSAQPEGNPTGLSDLIETRAKELKEQKLNQHLVKPAEETPRIPPPRSDCCTLSYRTGAPHKPLTLYHTMKMQAGQERMAAYHTAFTHCTRANSGLTGWLQKQSEKGVPAVMQSYTPQRKKSTKKSILRPILPGKKRKTSTEDAWSHPPLPPPTSDTSANRDDTTHPAPPANSTIHPEKVETDSPVEISPTDVLSAAHALLPNQSPMALHQSLSRSNVSSKPYEHIDTPRQPLPKRSQSIGEHQRPIIESRSNTSLSVDTDDARSTKGGFFGPLRKKSMRSLKGVA